MFPLILNPLSIILSLTATVGVLIHDTQIDNAAKATSFNSAVIVEASAGEIKLSSVDQHIHASQLDFQGLGNQQPAAQPRGRDDKKYIAIRRLIGDGAGSEYSWPTT